MTTNNKNNMEQTVESIGPDFFDHLWKESWTYIKTVVDVVREPILILDKDFRVMVANEPFYRTFQVEPTDTENKIVYELGNGQWNIPALKKLLEDILPKNTFFKGFEVTHEFPFIGRKMMILNARKIYFKQNTALELIPPIILLAIEDVTEIMFVAETFAKHSNRVENLLVKRTKTLEISVKKLKNELNKFKKSQS